MQMILVSHSNQALQTETRSGTQQNVLYILHPLCYLLLDLFSNGKIILKI